MEKIYRKDGYSYVDDYGETVDVLRTDVEKSITVQTNLLNNIKANLDSFAADIAGMDAA